MANFLIIDGTNFAHIAYHRAKSIIIKNKSADRNYQFSEDEYSEVEGMMYVVFFRKLHKYIKKFKDYNLVIAWDNSGSSEWRREIYPAYKASRDYNTDPIWRVLFTGMDKIREVLKCYPITQERVEKLEADDILYVFSRDLTAAGHKVVIISGDSDMIQMSQEFGVKLFHPIKDKYIKPPTTYDYCTYKAIKGDKADEISGINGYGEKKSTKLAESLYNEDFIDNISCTELNEEQQAQVLLNLRLIRISNNPNLNKAKVDFDKIEASNSLDLNGIKKHYFDLKLTSLLSSFESVIDIFK